MGFLNDRPKALILFGGLALATLAGCMQAQRNAPLAPRLPANYGLFYLDEGASVKLAYGAPNSDDVGFMMQCAKGSHAVEISAGAGHGATPMLTLTSEGHSATLKGAVAAGDGSSILTAHAQSDVGPLKAFRGSGRLRVAYAVAHYDVVANSAEKTGVDRFFIACDQPA